jgi:hypothetical protein
VTPELECSLIRAEIFSFLLTYAGTVTNLDAQVDIGRMCNGRGCIYKRGVKLRWRATPSVLAILTVLHSLVCKRSCGGLRGAGSTNNTVGAVSWDERRWKVTTVSSFEDKEDNPW